MRNILVVGQAPFIADFEVTILTGEIEDIEFGFATSIEQAVQLLDDQTWDECIVFGNFLESLDLASIEVPVTSYARDVAGLDAAAKEHIKSYGIVNRSSELLNNIINGAFVTVEAPESPKTALSPEDGKLFTSDEKVPQKADKELSDANEQDIISPQKLDTERILSPNQPEAECFGQTALTTSKHPESHEEEALSIPVTNIQHHPSGTDIRRRLQEIRRQKAENVMESGNSSEESPAPVKSKAHIITVYSAKGGVGKTTIACNLATFLALTEAGRDHYQVAILDFDIDFGDVMSTLGYDSDKVCMTAWVNDIKSRIMDGAEPEDIHYTEREIRSFMQKKSDSGLYALLAPLNNEDSMEINEEEIRIILQNVVSNGGFDFVVIDTGNNTRDAAIIPIESSDHVLIVLTQSVNTANCCYGFIRIISELGFDMSRMKTVINEIRPGRAVGVSVSELEEILSDPATGKPFPCIGKINDDNDVRLSVNDMVPLVYRSNHEYTKSIGRIASAIIGEEHVLDEPKKKKGRFFNKMFHR